ncbi:MAG: ABC transporter permease [Blastocatellia bacterium]
MRFYNILLLLYPASFRTEYGDEMRAIFARRRRESSGPVSQFALYAGALLEVSANAVAEHWDLLRQDLRYTWRTLRRTPAFTLTAVVVVALGIGANAAAFSITDFVFIRPLPYPESDRLVKVWENVPGYPRMELSPANYRDWKAASTAFEQMAAFNGTSVNMVGQGEPERVDGIAATADLLPMLKIQPLFGRWFNPDEDRDGAAGTLLLSYSLWQTKFGADPEVLGKQVALDNRPYTVIGVMPRDFYFPTRNTRFWMPAQYGEEDFQDRTNNYLQSLARLRPGVSLQTAEAQMSVIATQFQQKYPRENENVQAAVISVREELGEQVTILLGALCAAALCVLLIACANIASLLLTRGLSRRRELAIRTALGGGRQRLVRQLITESLVLAVLGGALGLVLALAALPLLSRLVPDSLPIAGAPSIDLRVLGFAALVTVLTGLGFGVVPALRACGGADMSGLREGVRSGGGRKEKLRSALVACEVMASVVLLVASGLLMRALWKIQGTDPGFRADGVLTLRTTLPMPKYEKTAVREQFYTRVLTDVRSLPGISNAAYISFLPMGMTGGIWPVSVDGQYHLRTEAHVASSRFVTPGFFASMGIPQKLGRDVSESDTADQAFVAVVSESFVRRYWPGENPIGRHFQFGSHDRVVAGVVGDIRVRGLERTSEPQVYLPYKQIEDGAFEFYAPKALVVRSSAPEAELLPAIREIIHKVDPEQPVSDVRTMDQIVEQQTSSRAVQLRAIAVFAVIAFLLAGIGIHGLLSFAVSQRSQEFGVRIALGARSRDILATVLRQGVAAAVLGALPGIALAYAAGHAMGTLLAGVNPADLSTFAGAVGLCVLMTLVGSLIPALRAIRVDPIRSLRSE